MAEDVWEYFDQRRRECRDLSVAEGDLDYYEEEGSGGQWGHVVGNITLSDVAYLSVHEVVRVEDGHAHREEYGYFLVIEGWRSGARSATPCMTHRSTATVAAMSATTQNQSRSRLPSSWPGQR